jgi:hypothetical protein
VIVYRPRRNSVFIKACLVSIIVLLAAILMTQRAEKVVHAQGHIEYKVVDVEVDVPADWKSTLSGANAKYLSTQDALNLNSEVNPDFSPKH